MTYSNPRMNAIIEGWPIGRQRCTATFSIETDPKRGQRAVRVTVGAPKKLTYATKVRIVDGDDGRTYIIELTCYGFISVMNGDMKYQHEVIHDSDPRYRAVLELFALDCEGQ